MATANRNLTEAGGAGVDMNDAHPALTRPDTGGAGVPHAKFQPRVKRR